MSAKTYLMGNLKGGVSKTTVTTMLAYQTAVFRGEKTLVIDMDPSPGATKLLAKTANITEITKSITGGFMTGDLTTQIMPVLENLDMIPGDESFGDLTRLLEQLFPGDLNAQFNYLNILLEPLREEYDRIFIDLPPSQHDYHRNAILASDYCILPLQIQDPSLDAAELYIRFMNDMAENYDADIQVLSIVPVAVSSGSKEEQFSLDTAREMYGTNVYEHVLPQRERIRTFARDGIQHPDEQKGLGKGWTKEVHEYFSDLWDELQEVEKYFETL